MVKEEEEMNLKKLFEAQKSLDERIIKEHGLEGQDLLQNKILALLVELGECANEHRGFKHWSKDQEPRTFIRENCPDCEKKGFVRGNPPKDENKGVHGLGNHWYHCDKCNGHLVIDKNPLLEEYVDCLRFILSIGLDIEKKYGEKLLFDAQTKEKDIDITNQFLELSMNITSLYISTVDEYYDFEDTVGIFIELFESFITLGEMLGFTWEQVEEAYWNKNKVNHARQEGGAE
jgi:dimeric dUTPase (all-alpha-NTP-PPase superfamily)